MWPASAAPEITPTVGDPVTDHVEGWRRAMREAGRSTEGRLFQAPYNRYDAYQVALGLLAGPDRPPAIFCSTDDQAIGVLRAARELRIDVPGELAVAGFDDVKEAGADRSAADDGRLRPRRRWPARRSTWCWTTGCGSRARAGERVRQFPSALVVRRSCGCACHEDLGEGLSGRRPGGPSVYAVAGVSVQVPPVRVSPRLISRRRLRAAARVWSQASFLMVPR